MSNKNSDHKQMLIAKCYELALVECSLIDTGGGDDVETVDFLDRIHKAADIWTKVDEKIHIQQMRDSSSREKKPVT